MALSLVLKSFHNFCQIMDFRHLNSLPFHPTTNDFAKNVVKSFKQVIKMYLMEVSNQHESFQTIENRYLFHYGNSVHVTTVYIVSRLMFKHHIRTKFDLLSAFNKVYSSRDKQVANYRGKDGKYLK